MIKRAFDIVAAGVGSIVSAPLVALLAAAIRLESPGHPIYRQTRIGKDGEPFSIYKLRTMVRGAEFTGAGLAIQEGDDRITRMGTLLRRYSLDELPNLWNVLRGEMSIVGPRPTVQVQVEQYTERQRGRLAVKPGLTGWAQVNGRASLPWPERIELDLWYVEHESLALDLKILAQTVGMVFSGKGLYKGRDGRMAAPGVGVLLDGRGQALRHRLGVRPARDRDRGRPQSARSGPVRGAPSLRRAPDRGPAYVPALQALCDEHNVGAVVPLTDLDIEVLAHARAAGELPAFVPDPEIARATYDKYEAHLLLERLGLPSPPTVLPGRPCPRSR